MYNKNQWALKITPKLLKKIGLPGIFSEKDKYHIINKNTTAAQLYGLFKLQKNETPLRPLVSYTNTTLDCYKTN